ncbi:MAG: DUF6588 family protein [Sphingobacteriaceae bacterium]
MKKSHSIARKVTFSVLCMLLSFNTFAQDEISELFKSSQADAGKLIEAYLNPFFKGMGNGLNSGWNNTGSPKKLGRFELRFGLTGSMIPDKDKTFDVTQIGLSNNLKPTNPALKISQTVGGEEVDGPSMDILDNNQNKVGEFTMPQGAKLPFVPTPQLQATIGLIKGIDLTVRTVPNIKLGQDAGSVGMFGAGVKIDLIQFIAGKKVDKILPFDLAAAMGFTNLNYKLPLEVKDANNNVPDPDQQLEAKFSGFNMEAIISKKLLFFTPFLSVGYQSAKSNVDLKGTYPFQTAAGTVQLTDPIAISQKSISGLRTNLGFQMNLAFLRLYGSYSIGAYKAFNAGIGLGIGK